jgi:hypothetical protein
MLAIGVILWQAAAPRSYASEGETPGPKLSIQEKELRHSANLLTMSNVIVTADLFRLARRPAAILYGADPMVISTVAPVPPKPRLTVSGILGGPPWDALLDGIPGTTTGVLVREGDTLSGLRIRRVTRDSVEVSGRDTTWHLGLKEVWR